MIVDFHSHLIPGVDDGAATLTQSLSAVAEMRRQGVRRIVTTPHFNVSLLRRRRELEESLALMDARWNELLVAVTERFADVQLYRGAELALDEPVGRIADERLRLAGTAFALVEFPSLNIPPNSGAVLAQLRAGGTMPIVAHPERYLNLDSQLSTLREWKTLGAFLQVNTGSVLGSYGPLAQRLAKDVLRAGMADYLSCDYHARGRFQLLEGSNAFAQEGMESQWDTLTAVNPGRLLDGLAPEAVPGLSGAPPSRWDPRRLLARIRAR